MRLVGDLLVLVREKHIIVSCLLRVIRTVDISLPQWACVCLCQAEEQRASFDVPIPILHSVQGSAEP